MDSTLSSHLIVAALVAIAVIFLVIFELDSRRNEAKRRKTYARETPGVRKDAEDRECA